MASPEDIFRQAIERHRAGKLIEALALYDAILAQNAVFPYVFDVYLQRAKLLLQLKRPQEALSSLEQALKIQPDHADALVGMATTLTELIRPYDALDYVDRALTLNPSHAIGYMLKATLLRDMKQPGEALRNFDRVLALTPNSAAAHNSRGSLLQAMGRHDAALEDFDHALALAPQYAEAQNNKALVLQSLNRLDEALEAFDRAIAMAPQSGQAHWNKALCALLMGRFAEGWALYEWRRHLFDSFPSFTRPEWRGDRDIAGKTVLVYAEQSLGDTIQFCRYAPLLAARGAKVILSVQDDLMTLLQSLEGGVSLHAMSAPLPEFDYHVPLLSLPLATGTSAHTVPAPIPYLRAEPARVEKWKNRIGTHGFKVGICWQGNRQEQQDVGRSPPLSCFAPLSGFDSVRLISLQKGDGAEQLNHLPEGMQVETLGEDFDAWPDVFADTAAVMETLDLVVTSDQDAAHLAGALGHPTWLALKQVPDWRWQMDREDSPWYPSMRLFRQARDGDWTGVFARMQSSLRALIQATNHS